MYVYNSIDLHKQIVFVSGKGIYTYQEHMNPTP